jgi:hypothetical protein
MAFQRELEPANAPTSSPRRFHPDPTTGGESQEKSPRRLLTAIQRGHLRDLDPLPDFFVERIEVRLEG